MVSPNNKRPAASLDDDKMMTPKKEKKTPAKTPKTVKLETGNDGSPVAGKSPMISTPLVATTSAKKAVRKTPAKQKNLDAVSTPKNATSPQAGKLSQPSPVQTRSARRKKAETVGTPVVAVTPSAAKNVRALNSKATPKSQKTTPHAKGRKSTSKTAEPLKLKLEDSADSDALDSDDEGSIDSDDIPSDNENDDNDRVERLKLELNSILNKPSTRKSILKVPKAEPAEVKTPSKKQLKTPSKTKTPLPTVPDKTNETTPARESKSDPTVPSPRTPKANGESLKETKPSIGGKRPSPSVEKTPSKKARRSIKAEVNEPNEDNEAEDIEEGAVLGNKVHSAKDLSKTLTPNKTTDTQVLLNNSITPSGKKQADSKSPANKSQDSNKLQTTPKAAQQNQGQIKTPVGQEKAQSKTPLKTPGKTPVKSHVPEPPISETKLETVKNQTPGKTPMKNGVQENLTTEALTPAKKLQTPGKDLKKSVEKKAQTPGQTPAKTPAKVVQPESKTPSKSPQALKTPAKDSKEVQSEASKGQSPATTPAKKVKTEPKTPSKSNEAKDSEEVQSEVSKGQSPTTTPAKKVKSEPKTPSKSPHSLKTPTKDSKEVQLEEVVNETQSMTTETTTTSDASTKTKRGLTAEQIKAKREKKKAKLLQKKKEREANKEGKEPEELKQPISVEKTKKKKPAAKSEEKPEEAQEPLSVKNQKKKEAAVKSEEKPQVQNQPISTEKQKKKIDPVSRNVTKEVLASSMKQEANAKRKSDDGTKMGAVRIREERAIEVRAKLLAKGKSEEEIQAELPLILARIDARIKRTVCIGCRKVGHVLKECTTFKAKPSGKCYKCGSTSHSVKGCSITEEIYPFANCFICNQMGHLTRSCPSKKTGVYPFGGACFKCGDVNHLSKNCTGKKLQDENTNPSADSVPVKPVVGILDTKQSADADVDVDTPSKKPLNNSAKQGMKKRVVKF